MTEASNRKGILRNNNKFHFYTIVRAMQGREVENRDPDDRLAKGYLHRIYEDD